jgi:choline kinase
MTNLIQEFQVVILPGGAGRRMFPLIEDTPKCLLPVANRPLLSYQLELLERVGFKGNFKIYLDSLSPGGRGHCCDKRTRF